MPLESYYKQLNNSIWVDRIEARICGCHTTPIAHALPTPLCPLRQVQCYTGRNSFYALLHGNDLLLLAFRLGATMLFPSTSPTEVEDFSYST